MKKKLVALLALAAFAGASAFIVGCGDADDKAPPHTRHELAWAYDDDGHWQYCTVDGCDHAGAKSDHSLTWEKDGDGHWQYCTVDGCDYAGAKTDHVDELDNESNEPGKDGKCDDCGMTLVAGEHDHVMTWKSNDDEHWQICSVLGCTEVVRKSAHVDAINNETKTDGADGKCDDCGNAIKYTVTFNGDGHDVTLPAAQKVEHGKKAVKPADLAKDGDYEFVGWYSEDKATEFDFDAPVTENAVIYAKWEAAVGSKVNSAQLTLGQQKLLSFSSDGNVYYSFTASEYDRYTIAPANGANSRKCRFTTSLADDDGVWYGYGCDESERFVELEQGESVTITLTCLEQLDADAKVSVLVNKVTDEPLPADKYITGFYIDDNGTYKIEIDRENGVVKYNGNSISYRYVGGSFDKLSFSTAAADFTLKYESDGIYALSSGEVQTTLRYVNENDLVDVSAFRGIYEPETSGDVVLYVKRVAIDVNGKGYYESTNGKRTYVSVVNYDRITGRLDYGQIVLSVNLDADGNAASIQVKSNGGEITEKTYMRVGDAPAEIINSLPIEEGTYSGAEYTIRKETYSTYWGESGSQTVDVDGYDGSKYYTISISGSSRTVYKIDITDNGAIELYSVEDGTLLDTLTKPEPIVLPVLSPSDDEQQVSTQGYITCADWKNTPHKLALYEVCESGYYVFNTPDGYSIYVGVNAENPGTAFMFLDPIAPDEAIEIEAGTVVGLLLDDYGSDVPETVPLTMAQVTPPATGAEDDPFVVADNGVSVSATGNMTPNTPYYFSFTAPSAGNYKFTFRFFDNGSWQYSNKVHFTVNGVEYGCTATYAWQTDSYTYEWKGGMTEDDPYYRCALAGGETIIFIADLQGQYWATDVTLTAERDAGGSYTSLNIYGQIENGTFVDAVQDGSYNIKGTAWASMYSSVDGLEFTSSTEFTINVGGEERTGKSISLLAWELESGFEIVGGPVSMSLYYTPGKEGNPIVVDPADVDATTHTVGVSATNYDDSGCKYAWISITAGDKDLIFSIPDYTYVDSYGDDDENAETVTVKFYFVYDGDDYGYYASEEDFMGYVSGYTAHPAGTTLEIAANTTVTIKIGTEDFAYDQDEISVMLVEANA